MDTHPETVAAVFTQELLGYVQPGDVHAERPEKDILNHVRNNVESTRPKFERMEDLDILDWLTPMDYCLQQSDYLQRRQPGTGHWLLDSPVYQTWLNSSKQTLFCPGIPGAGKTITTAIVIDDLYSRFHSDPSVGIAYIYCNFRRRDEQKVEDLVASLLKQLSQGRSTLPDSVKDLYYQHKDKRSRPSFGEISRVLRSVVATYSRVFIIVDALDECQNSDGCRTRFLSDIFRIQFKYKANIFATSRFLPQITDYFERSVSLEIRASDEDISRYLDGRMFGLPSFVLRNLELQQEIKTEIIKSVDGMFLLAQLHLDSLIGKRSPKAIRSALKKLPTGSEAYDDAYDESMRRISGQVKDSVELAMQTLSWITCAKRQLTALELQYALAVEVGEPELDIDNLPMIEDMVSVCAGLVTVDAESNIIRLVHYTAQEYFERTQKFWFPNAETEITTVCVTYLSFSAFKNGFCQTDGEFEERLQCNPLYDYAACKWGYHARESYRMLNSKVVNFLQRDSHVQASSQSMIAAEQRERHSNYTQEAPRYVTGLHLASYFGLAKVIQDLVSGEHGPDSRDSYGRTPLSWAAENGYETVVVVLLKMGVEPNSMDTNGQTPLHWAAKNGHEIVVVLLLNMRAEPNSTDINGQTPLHWAAKNGHGMVVESLIRAGAHMDLTDDRRSTALHESIKGDHHAIQELLIELGANLDIEDKENRTPSDLAWSKKRLDWSAYVIDDLTKSINQGAQARCEVLRRKDGGATPQVIFRKVFNVSESAGRKVRRYLLREHKILQKLNHPFIVSYLGYEEDVVQKTAALYMEFCEGGDLQSQHIQEKTNVDDDSDDSCCGDKDSCGIPVLHPPVPLQEGEVWAIIFQLAAAMAYLHHGLSIKNSRTFCFEKYWESVIHRDIKPANIVSKAAENGRNIAKLCDLGLVKAVLGAQKQTMGIGTRDYSPPEVRLRKGWTLKGDIYSFGVTIDDLYKEIETQPRLSILLERCKSADPSARPSSLSIIEIAQEHVAHQYDRLCLSLHKLLGSEPGGYLYKSLIEIASGLDEYAAWGDETRHRRKRTLGRLGLLCDDGAGDLFDRHSESLHLSVLLNRQNKLQQLLVNDQNTDVNEKWRNSGWTPLHLAVQEDNQDMVALLMEYRADLEVTDKYRRRPDHYRERKM